LFAAAVACHERGEPGSAQRLLRQIIDAAALRFPQARVLAVDLSLASLAYARRKTHEANVSNIEYAQADILKLGSLHHLGNPEAGWRTLLSFRPGGLLLVGLYSALARRSITTARARIADWGYRSSPAHIRECRQELIKRRLQAASPDFFTASGFRDLYLRVAERQFTVADIASWVQVAGVKFRGFEIDDSLREQFDERHHGANSQDLSAWDVFEQGCPHAFVNMYQFLVQKRGPEKLSRDKALLRYPQANSSPRHSITYSRRPHHMDAKFPPETRAAIGI
jgi:SAM-dependent methyltransferase